MAQLDFNGILNQFTDDFESYFTIQKNGTLQADW
jgi:hypothetical protein